MQIGNRDIEKMLGYYAKGSDPKVLARTVKDLNKAKSRSVIAHAMGWNAAARYFRDRCEELGCSQADLDEIDSMYNTYDLPANYRSKFEGGPKLEDASRLRDWFPKLFKVLRDNGVENFTLKTRTPKGPELERDRTDGRCWTLGYTLEFDLNGQHYKWELANHTNEGGGSFGVSGLGQYYINQQALANLAARALDAANESTFTNATAFTIMEAILSGADIRKSIVEFTNAQKMGTKE